MRLLCLFFFFFMFFSSVFSQESNELEKTLIGMLEKEQDARKNLSSIYAEWNGKEEFQHKRDSVSLVMLKIDSVNQKFVANLLDTTGWPDSLSPQANMAIFMIIQHSPASYMDKYAPLVKMEYEKGHINSELYAIFADRLLMRQNKPQLYGSQIINNYVWPIQDLDSLDVRRGKMNLPPYQKYLDSFKDSGMEIIWNKELNVDDLIKILGFSPKDVR
ncbi:hypothetical protein JGH11_05420 [Dysgonomonas sp. Marseille-P4677]|uniref:DUF6624 domain-containing protein n=1 Tax=Dysgonomonas sp. Marseille-P4677 TaxID=2364790 RepID=UPI001914422D|nr:DUF6624 domain-containing protein [Dysgonomonas sp. Marseille-P4677]MBK5720303.1 hypothetical protein [Dysgonomonas sp. Marseille-P4677]